MSGPARALPATDGWPAPEGPAALRRLVRECVAAGVGRSVLLLRLAALPAGWRKPHHLRLAREAMAPLLHAERARGFRLPNDDLVAIWRGDAAGAEQRCRTAIAHLFADAGLAAPADLLRRLDLPDDAAPLLEAVAEAERSLLPPPPPRPALPPLDPGRLVELEARLAPADVARFARRRDICAPDPRGRFAVRWEKRFLSVAELAAELAPGHDPRGDPWLFRRLTRTLDQRMLALLSSRGELRGAGPFAINLNVASILSPGFLRFDAALPPLLRGHVVLDVALADTLADPAAFRFARDFARARGYRVLLRGIADAFVEALIPAGCAVDYLQLRWSPALAARARLPFDPACVVLGRCDDATAVAEGRRLGIGLFQGAAVARGRPCADDRAPG